MTRVAADDLEAFAADVLVRAGMRRAHAQLVAAVMVGADRFGVASHGVARLSTYLDRVDRGSMSLDPDMTIDRSSPATALLNAHNGFGQLAATRAMEIAVDKARAVGAGVVSVAHSNHFGIAGHYARTAAEAGFVGITMTNASPAMPPFNGSRKLLGTNPVAIGVPAASQPVAVLDMSSTVVARGKIRRAVEQGQDQIPAGWAYDAQGRPTTDADAALGGFLAPVGGAKGAGLSLVIDLLTGVLSGTGVTGSVVNLLDASAPSGTGHLVIALDPEAFVGRDVFVRTVDGVLAGIAGMDAVDGGTVYYPGLIEHERAAENAERGVLVADDAVARLRQVAERFGVTLPLC